MLTRSSSEGTSSTAAWQAKLLPFMMTGLAVMAVLFFLGTFWNYAGLQSRLDLHEPEITVALEKLHTSTTSPAYQDWYMRVVLEDRALRSRHHQNTAVIESRVWTRFMGFMTGMMMVLCGCIFILGKLEAQFDGSAKASGGEGAMKTNSPGLVLAVVGSVLIAVSLSVSVTVEVIDRPVYLADLGQPVERPAVALPPPSPLPAEIAASVPAAAPSTPPPLPAELAREMCKQAGRPADCMK
jgi:hypothetical protein